MDQGTMTEAAGKVAAAMPGMTEAAIRSAIAQLQALLPERSLTVQQLWDAHQLTLPDMPWVGSMRSTMKLFLARYGESQVSAFGPAQWEEYRTNAETKARYCVTTRGIQLRRAKAMFSWAVRTDVIPFNPLARVKHERGKPKRETEISHDGEAALLARVDPMMRAFVLAALDGAMRRNELRLIEWSHVDLAARTVTLHAANTKTKKLRVVRLTPRAIEAIGALPRYPGCPYVFANPNTKLPFDASSLWRRWREAVDGAGLEPAPGDGSVRLHDCRGTAISRLSRLGAPVPVIQRLVGHGSAMTTLTYIRVNAQDVEDAYALLVKSQRKGPQRAGAQGATAPAKKKARA